MRSDDLQRLVDPPCQDDFPEHVRTSWTERIVYPDLDEDGEERIRATFYYLLDSVELASTEPELVMMQSVQGRAINGDWAPEYMDEESVPCYPNTTLEDIFEAVGEDVTNVQYARQHIIDDIALYLRRCVNFLQSVERGGNGVDHVILPLNNRGEPLGTIEMLRGTLISNPLHVNIGGYIGGCVDNAGWRARAEEKYGIRMHKGMSAPIHLPTLKQTGLTLRDLANGERVHAAMVESFRLDQQRVFDADTEMAIAQEGQTPEQAIHWLQQMGIASLRDRETYRDGYVAGYVETGSGYGISDDAVFMACSLLWGIEAGLGFLLVDAIDTWDKSAPKVCWEGQDERIGKKIKSDYESLLERPFPITDDDVLKVIYLAAIDSNNHRCFPSCSQRRFMQVDENTGLHAIQSHILYARHIREGSIIPPPLRLAFKQVPSHQFYGAFKERYMELAERGEIVQPYALPNGNGGSQ